MRKCVVSGDWIMENMVGVQRYTFQILCSIDDLIDNHKCQYEIELLIPQNAEWQSPFKHIKVVRKGILDSKIRKHIWQQIVFSNYVRRNKAIGIDLAAALPVSGCSIIAIHDCIHEAYPENFSEHQLYQKLYLCKVKSIVRNKNIHIVTLTNDSKHEIQKYYNVPDSRLSIVGCGWEHMNEISEDRTILQRLGLNGDDEFFFSLGSRYKHKNYIWVLNVARRNPKYKFVITGTDSYSNARDALELETPKNVIFTGYISDGEIKALYKECVALIQPSLYEGFGMPPLEALSVGGRAIVSQTSSLPEIYGSSVHYIDPMDYNYDLKNLMQEKTEDPSFVLQKYTWNNAAHQLLAVIDKVVK